MSPLIGRHLRIELQPVADTGVGRPHHPVVHPRPIRAASASVGCSLTSGYPARPESSSRWRTDMLPARTQLPYSSIERAVQQFAAGWQLSLRGVCLRIIDVASVHPLLNLRSRPHRTRPVCLFSARNRLPHRPHRRLDQARALQNPPTPARKEPSYSESSVATPPAEEAPSFLPRG